MASYVLCQLAGRPYEPERVERMSAKLKHKVKQLHRKNEIKRFGTDDGVDIDDDDIEFIAQQVWRCRCAVSNRRFGGQLTLTLSRWHADQPPTPYNLVLLMQDAANQLMEKGHSAFPMEIQKKISERLEWAKDICKDSYETLDGIKQSEAKEAMKRIEALRKKPPVNSIGMASNQGSHHSHIEQRENKTTLILGLCLGTFVLGLKCNSLFRDVSS
jgi:hypothetical protein